MTTSDAVKRGIALAARLHISCNLVWTLGVKIRPPCGFPLISNSHSLFRYFDVVIPCMLLMLAPKDRHGIALGSDHPAYTAKPHRSSGRECETRPGSHVYRRGERFASASSAQASCCIPIRLAHTRNRSRIVTSATDSVATRRLKLDSSGNKSLRPVTRRFRTAPFFAAETVAHAVSEFLDFVRNVPASFLAAGRSQQHSYSHSHSDSDQ